MPRLDPRTKLLATIILILVTFSITQGFQMLVVSGLLLITLIISHTPLSRYARNVMLLSWLLLFTFLLRIWQDISFVPALTVDLSPDTLKEGGLAVGRLLLVVGWGTVLGATSSPLDIVTGLERLLRPVRRLGVPVQTLSTITMLTLRFIPILLEERRNLVHAYIARGLDLQRGSLFVRLKNYLLVCMPLVSSLLRRVEQITVAMETRRFQAGTARTALYELHMRVVDYLLLGGCLLFWGGIYTL
ncbi:hypothetical protein GF339_03980 [candidate division KSB3 bacterium]|uniref:Energy-coupling factor transporter transmembrane protein EcfT n=1 Tax=candidate division KSB3 bacterium TaxID=2044937 RepID=A0A9D5JT14_9BACT|nr:hypothetical protein [candidate division KSB3 bacterium]MBD3323718.1 hypothetical protein [candidate division KSB3 bacterium]